MSTAAGAKSGTAKSTPRVNEKGLMVQGNSAVGPAIGNQLEMIDEKDESNNPNEGGGMNPNEPPTQLAHTREEETKYENLILMDSLRAKS